MTKINRSIEPKERSIDNFEEHIVTIITPWAWPEEAEEATCAWSRDWSDMWVLWLLEEQEQQVFHVKNHYPTADGYAMVYHIALPPTLMVESISAYQKNMKEDENISYEAWECYQEFKSLKPHIVHKNKKTKDKKQIHITDRDDTIQSIFQKDLWTVDNALNDKNMARGALSYLLARITFKQGSDIHKHDKRRWWCGYMLAQIIVIIILIAAVVFFLIQYGDLIQ
jgi:hypothetical protein